MNTRVWESWHVVGVYTEIPIIDYLKKCLRPSWFFLFLFFCFFRLVLTFYVRVQIVKYVSLYTSKSIVFTIILQNIVNAIVTAALAAA